MIKIEEEKVWKEIIKGKPIKEYLYEKLNLSDEYAGEILQRKVEFEKDKLNYSVRGKWALAFMVKLLEYIMENAKCYASSLYVGESNAPKRLCQLTQDGAMVMLAPRMVPAESLEKFLDKNIDYA